MAERDPLTKIVVKNLGEAQDKQLTLPAEIQEMLGVLPLEIRSEVEAEWSEAQRGAVLNDVGAIILDTLRTKGGQDS